MIDEKYKEKSTTKQSDERTLSLKGLLSYLDGGIFKSHPFLFYLLFYW
jgi:hypothetical protein